MAWNKRLHSAAQRARTASPPTSDAATQFDDLQKRVVLLGDAVSDVITALENTRETLEIVKESLASLETAMEEHQ